MLNKTPMRRRKKRADRHVPTPPQSLQMTLVRSGPGISEGQANSCSLLSNATAEGRPRTPHESPHSYRFPGLGYESCGNWMEGRNTGHCGCSVQEELVSTEVLSGMWVGWWVGSGACRFLMLADLQVWSWQTVFIMPFSGC